MGGRWRRLARSTLAVALCVLAALPASTVAARAQDPVTGFFNMLFGGGRRQAPVQIERIPSVEPPQAPAAPPKRPKPPDVPRVVETPKNPDAQTVLVLGDIEAAGLAAGLDAAFAEEPALVVKSKVKNGTGLVREGDADWIAQTPKALAEAKPDFVVTMIGINDWQPLTPPGGKALEPGGDEWERLYADRIDRYVAALKASGKPFWWVGLPPTADADLGPTRRAAFSAFLSSLNDLARPRVEAAGGTFVDVWTAFTDEEGHYTQTGPDVDGQMKRLRTNDGILFTAAGRRKLAFFVETGIVKLKRGESPIAVAPEAPIVQPTPELDIVGAPPPLPPAPWAVAGPVVPLDGPPTGGEATLAGGADKTPPTALPGGYPVAATPAHRRFSEGAPLDPPVGRVDAGVRRLPETGAAAGVAP